MTTGNKTGRPSLYTPELADLICERLAEGESLRSVCRDDNMPSKATIFSWMRLHQGFLDQYTRAKEESADAWADEIMDIADNGANDWMEVNDPENPGYKLNGEHVQRSKLRIDTRKWAASKLKPKKYGDYARNSIPLEEGEEGSLVIAEIRRTIVKPEGTGSTDG